MRIANAPCSWGALEFDLPGQAAVGYEQVLDEAAETGYEGIELGDWGFMPTDPEVLKEALARRGLTLVAGFVPVALASPSAYAEGEDKALRTASLLRAVGGEEALLLLADDNGTVTERTRYAGRITSAMGLDEEQWQGFASRCQRIARAVREKTGLRTAFHHHCAGFVETPQEIATLMRLTDHDLVGLCLDTGHALYGGGDPIALLQRYADRVWHVHLKDCDPKIAQRAREEGWDYFQAVAQRVFCELGQGAVPFAALKEMLLAQGYRGWLVVEQDIFPGMGAPKESARRNRQYLARLGL